MGKCQEIYKRCAKSVAKYKEETGFVLKVKHGDAFGMNFFRR